jgi:hypothetical protein
MRLREIVVIKGSNHSDELEAFFEVVEVAPLVHQLIKGTALDHLAVVEDKDGVRIADGVKSVGNR